MDRRALLGSMTSRRCGGRTGHSQEASAQEQAARAMRGMPVPKIKDISVIECAPKGSRLDVVKRSPPTQAGLFGYGCATFTQRADLIETRRSNFT